MKKYILSKLGLFFILISTSQIVNAAASVGEVSGNLSASGNILAKVLWSACIIVGIILFFTAFTQYQIHRTNPKLVPLGVPFTYILLSIACFTIPFAERIVDAIQDISVEEEISISDAKFTDYDEDEDNY